MASEIEKIVQIFSSEYSVQNYVLLVQELFNNIKLVAPDKYRKEFTNFSSHIAGSSHVGNYTTLDGKKMIIFSVQLLKRTYVEGSRSTQRNYVKKLIENAGADAALVAFYTEGDPKWRLSYVRLDYEIKFENGKLKAAENMTPAKRYSYLLGKDEPCHTAVDRFRRFVTDRNFNPTLDELEEAFSVEAVTNEFFNLYCEKFKQLLAHLEDNPDFVIEAKQHNFTAAQFAKKLMGQIVFLYFLQKKGWLGVSAWPDTLTEKEYKNAFYARGAKSRELIPLVYKQLPDGTYKVSAKGLEMLSDEDETILAQCVKGKPWGTGPRDFMRKLFNWSQKRHANYFDDYLEPLFYNALNRNRGEQGYDPDLHCRIPFLSGGLFEPIDGYDWENNDFALPNEIFSNRINDNPRTGDGILDVFDRYNFTMSEDEPMEREVAIDPEMLGKVFENLLEVNDRKSKGAFYTPREIVHYMCRESLIDYLTPVLGVSESAVRDFILYGDFIKDQDTVKEKRQGNGGMLISEELYKLDSDGKVVTDRLGDMDKALADVRVADPAVGSGAFPLGMLNEIVKARQNITAYMAITMNAYDARLMYSLDRSPHTLKYETIRNCIYAADIEPSAVDIAQLRLWLSLVIDDEINPEASNQLEGHRNPLPLPNLECNILCGNSLLSEFDGIPLINQSELIGTEMDSLQTNMFQYSFNTILPKLIDAQKRLFECVDTIEKQSILEEIASLKDMIILSQLKGRITDDSYKRYMDTKRMASKPYVLWELDFSKVFREKGGFDIVIGNPPYVDSEEMTRSMPEQRELYSKRFECARGNWDLFVPFIEKGMNLLSEGKIISFIVPNKLVAAPYTETLRKMISKNQVIEMRDYSSVNVFKAAAVYPVVFRIRKSDQRELVTMDVMSDMQSVSNHNEVAPDIFYADINWDKYFSSSQGTLEIIAKMEANKPLNSFADVNGAATVSEAYLIKEFMYDGEGTEIDSKKFINTGGIDRYKSYFGEEYIRYLKAKYMHPMVPIVELEKMSSKRLKESNAPKIIIGGMTKILECYYDEGQYLAGKSTTIVYNSEHLRYLTAVLNSKLMTFFYRTYFNSMSLQGGFFRIGAPQIKNLPIAWPNDNAMLETIELYVDQIQQSISQGDAEAIDAIDKAIDAFVYTVYGLSEQEVRVVEESFLG